MLTKNETWIFGTLRRVLQYTLRGGLRGPCGSLDKEKT